MTDQQRQSHRLPLLQQAARLARLAAWEYSRATGITERSGEFHDIFEVDPSDVRLEIGRSADGDGHDSGHEPIIERFLTRESRERFEVHWQRALETGDGWDLELEAVTARGRKIRVRFIGRVEFVDGRFLRAYGAVQDVTAQRELEGQLTVAYEAERVGPLTSGFAHDFNNLLTVMRGHLELAMEGVPKGSQFADDLAEVDKAARSATVLTKQLLNYSRREAPAPSASALPASMAQMEGSRGSETLLVCDDESSLRELISAGLRAHGYQVLEASEPSGAIAIAERHEGRIDLLVTDVVLPEMSGKGLAAAFLAIRPGVPVLYMSGFSADTMARSGARVPATPFIAKPFSPGALAHRVREMLDGVRGQAPGG